MQTTFIVHVEDQPGVLTRVASLIRRPREFGAVRKAQSGIAEWDHMGFT